MLQFIRQALLPKLLQHLAALLLVGITTALLRPLNNYLGAQVVALVYLLPVLLATYLWGLTPGILAGITSFLVFNYFYIPPFHTFAVHRNQDLITLIVFLIIAVFTSQLIGQAREGLQLARNREWEATRMYEMILALAGLQDYPSIARMLAQHTLGSLPCRQVEVLVEQPGDDGSISVTMPETGQETDPPVVRIPMMTARGVTGTARGIAGAGGNAGERGIEGEIRLWMNRSILTKEENRLLNTFASQGALAVERIRLSQSATKAHILEETDRAKSTLLSSVSHELRSPLAVIKASVSSLRSELVEWDTNARHELLATIEEETDHLNSLVGNLLDMSRIEAGALKPQRRWNSLAEIATGVVNRLRKHLQEYQVEMDFPREFPLVPTDYVLIDQVFTNLIGNSIKFAPPNSLINIIANLEGRYAHVQVTNQGPPVPVENLSRIFDKFNQVHANDRITGTGLGLSICKGIIEAHEGQIWAENTPCCFIFHFTLPLDMDGAAPQFPPEAKDE